MYYFKLKYIVIMYDHNDMTLTLTLYILMYVLQVESTTIICKIVLQSNQLGSATWNSHFTLT